jgi:hypothetical protein
VPFPVSAAFPPLGPPSSPPLALFDLLLLHFDVLRLRELPALAGAALKSLAISAESVRPALEAPQGGARAG